MSETQKTTKAFGERLTKLMGEMRPEELAAKNPAISFSSVMRYRAGAAFPRPRMLVDLARALGCTTAELLKDVPVSLRTRADVEAIANAVKP